MKTKLVYGVGVNDCGTTRDATGKRHRSYEVWVAMLKRCYSSTFQTRCPSYSGCTVCDEWLTFSNFKNWYNENEIGGDCQIDKDILKKNNKYYSPDTCAIVSRQTNMFVTDSLSSRGNFLIGCSFHKKSGLFQSRCKNTFTGKLEHLGFFSSEVDAHLAWRKRKHELALQLADMQTDERVAGALRVRYIQQGEVGRCQ